MVGSKDKRARPNLKSYPAFGKHSFVPNNGKPAPRFQIHSDVIIVKKTQQASSPKNPQRNVDWLQLETVEGNFAKRVYRTSTRGGKAPAAKCQSLNEIINQPYAAIVSFKLKLACLRAIHILPGPSHSRELSTFFVAVLLLGLKSWEILPIHLLLLILFTLLPAIGRNHP
jgi:hypothetical protein